MTRWIRKWAARLLSKPHYTNRQRYVDKHNQLRRELGMPEVFR